MDNLLLSLVALSNRTISTLSDVLGAWYFILFNAFGVLAVAFKICETQLKKRAFIILFATISTGCWMIYYVFNGNFTSALTSLIAIAKYIIFSQREKRKWANSVLWLYFFIAVQLVVLVFTYKDLTSLLATCAGILGTFAYYTVNPKKYRWTLLCCQSCWVLNGAFNLYYVALLSDSFVTVSIITAIIRFTIKEKKDKSVTDNASFGEVSAE